MLRAHIPFFIKQGSYIRNYSAVGTKSLIREKRRFRKYYSPSKIECIRDSHDTINFICAVKGCRNNAQAGIQISCDWVSHIIEVESWEELLPDEVPSESSVAIIPVCKSCDHGNRSESRIDIDESECILTHEEFEYDSYRYFWHCDERLVIDEDNPDNSVCKVCHCSVAELDFMAEEWS